MLIASSLAAEPVIVARSGVQIPDDVAIFTQNRAPGQKTFSVPAIDPSGRIGFRADLEGEGITPDVNDASAFTFRIVDGQPVGQEIVRRGDPAPSSGGTTFDLALHPNLGLGDEVMLYPSLSDRCCQHIYLWQPAAGLFPVAVGGEPVASFPDDTVWRVIVGPEYDGNATLFISTISGPDGFGTRGPDLFIQSGFGQDAFRLVARGEETSPGSDVNVENIVEGKYVTGGGGHAFVAELSPSSGSDFDALFIDGVQAQNEGDPAPDDGRAWEGWQRPDMNANGDLAITGRVAGNIRGIWLKPAGGAFDKILAEGETLPFDPSLSLGTHLPINPVVGNGGAVVFSGPLIGADVTTTNDGAMFWYGDDGSGLALKMPVREGDQAPFFDPGVVFSDVFATATKVNAVVDGLDNFAFKARLAGPGISGGNDLTVWVWLAERGALVPVLREGDPIEIAPGDVRTISETDFAIGGLDDAQNVVVRAFYGTGANSTDFPSGFMVLSVPTVPPLVVNSIGDAPDQAQDDKFCDTGETVPGGQPECTLRAAIQEANARAGADTIEFAIPGGSVPTITPGSPLPAATDAVTIDGTTQPEGQVELDGTGAAGTGLTIAADDSVVRGMVVNRFAFGGITVVGANNVTLEANRIGTGPDGLNARANGLHGVLLNDASNAVLHRNRIAGNDGPGVLIDGSGTPVSGVMLIDNQIGGAQAGDGLGNTGVGVHALNARQLTIGGTTPGDGNLISGNGAGGIVIEGVPGMDDLNQLFGNLIGTDSSGFFAHPNLGDGVRLGPDAEFNVIGGLTGGTGNLINNNLGNGVRAEGNATVLQDNRIMNNQVDPGAPFNASGHGVLISGSGNTIGDSDDAGRNLIVGNGGDGILVLSGNTLITRNSIFDNAGLGINLDEDGALATRDETTPNDAGDVDDGANGLQNWPLILRLTNGTDLVGQLSSAPTTAYTLEIFSNSQPGSPLQAETFLTETSVVTDADGFAEFAITLPQPGERISATATDPAGNTSEISVPPLIVNSTGDATDLNPGDAACDTGGTVGSDPECTLRAAIEEASQLAGTEVVTFDISGTPPHFITPSSALPDILSPIIIDATTQPGYAQRQPAVRLSGQFAGEAHGLVFAFPTPSELRGLIVSDFNGDGVVFDEGGLTLHDVIAIGNGNNGISGSGTLTATGLLRVENSNRDAVNIVNECGNTSGIKTQAAVVVQDLELINNCGYGLSTTGDLVVQGNLTVRDNTYDGLRVPGGRITISGSTHAVTGNGRFGIFSQEPVDISGTAEISDNGHQLEFPPNLRDPCGTDFGPPGVLSGTFAADDVIVNDNCGNGIEAQVFGLPPDFHVRIHGNATVRNNLGDGIFLQSGSIRLEGANHDVSGNGSFGLRAANGSVLLSGQARLANNFAVLRASNPGACLGDMPAALFAGLGRASSVHRGDVIAEDLTVVDNCGTGVKTPAVLDIRGNADISRNLGDGALASSVRILGGGQVAQNSRYGLFIRGGFVDADNVCICNNGIGIGIGGDVQPAQTSATTLNDGKYVSTVLASQAQGAADAPMISSSQIVGNRGDGIRMTGGSDLAVIGSNLYANGGLAIRNLSGSTIAAQSNWWGDASGPDGEGSGTGDQIAGPVDAGAPLAAPLPATDSDGDGIPDFVENGAHNDGDGNDDQIPDSLQAEVVSVANPVNGRYLTLAAPEPAAWSSVMAIGNPSPDDAPPGDFADGFFSASLLSVSDSIAVEVFQGAGDGIFTWFGFGPTPVDPSDQWHEFDFDGSTGFQSDPPLLLFSDGERGDHDLVFDGAVVHRGGALLAGPVADLGVTHASVEPQQVKEGQIVTYTLAISNAGPDPAAGLVLVNRLPEGFVLVDTAGDGWSCEDLEGTVTCGLQGLSAGQASELLIRALADTPGAKGNVAEITAQPFDPEPGDDVSFSLLEVPVAVIFVDGFETGQ